MCNKLHILLEVISYISSSRIVAMSENHMNIMLPYDPESYVNTMLSCKQVRHGVIEAIQTMPELDDEVLIDVRSLSFGVHGGLHWCTRTDFNSKDLAFKDRGTLQNNLVFIVNKLRKYTNDRMKYSDLDSEPIEVLEIDEILRCVSSCKDITVSTIPQLVSWIAQIRIITHNG
jgi:hypothetical protein